MSNPIFYHLGGKIQDKDEPEGWYFWDETWSHYEGPWDTYEFAAQALAQYVEWLQ